MPTSTYSHLFSCLYDQQEPIGTLGRGTHYSVFRSIQWRSLDGQPREGGRIHDFAVIWDEDHDERVISVIERLQMAGLMWPVIFIGERKGGLTILADHQAGPLQGPGGDYLDRVQHILSDVNGDSWSADFGTYKRDPANEHRLTHPAALINDDDRKVIAYLQAIDVLWSLGEKPARFLG